MDRWTGYPIASHFTSHKQTTQGGFNLGGINATGQLPVMLGNRGLIDVDTPQDAYTKQSYMSGDMLELVFSDEFNTEGRSFYPGDDPYWEAPNLHYWGTVRARDAGDGISVLMAVGVTGRLGVVRSRGGDDKERGVGDHAEQAGSSDES